MNLKVKMLTLHESYFPGETGNLPNKLNTAGDHKGMDITWTEAGFFVEYKGVGFYLPHAACKGATFNNVSDMRAYVSWKKTQGPDIVK